MAEAELTDSIFSPLIQQMVSSIDALDGERAIENALDWLRRQCDSEGAMFCQYRGPVLLTLVTVNVDPSWGQNYRERRMLADDPLVKYFSGQLGFVDWQQPFKRFAADDSYQQQLEGHRMLPGCSYGYASPGHGFQGVTSLCSLSGMNRPLKAADRYLLSSLVPVLHLVGRGVKLRSRGLSEKEIEVLEWARDGKTAWEIASIRQVSEATVKYHFKSIYAKLGVSNRAQAVGEALCQGIIR